MTIAQVTLSVSRDAGGLLDCVRGLARRLQDEQGMPQQVLGLADRHTADDLPGWRGVDVQVYPRRFGFAAPGLAAALARSEASLAHTHGLWSYCSPAVRHWANTAGRPYVVSPQGMLDVWALRNSRWKKRLAASFFERKHLAGAACLHAVCVSELDSIRAYGLRNPVCVIPNGVDLPPETAPTPRSRDPGDPARPKTLLFLGRLHPKKGLPNLLGAWARAAADNPAATSAWHLRIVGWDQGGHRQELDQLVAQLKLSDAVEFVGPLHGEAKNAALRAANAFVLPSFSEGLPLSVLEAWSHRLPVLMTPECNLPEGFAAGAAFRAAPEVDSLAGALGQLFATPPTELAAMGDRGRTLVEQRFTWSAVARSMAEVYRWLVDGGPAPGCVVSS